MRCLLLALSLLSIPIALRAQEPVPADYQAPTVDSPTGYYYCHDAGSYRLTWMNPDTAEELDEPVCVPWTKDLKNLETCGLGAQLMADGLCHQDIALLLPLNAVCQLELDEDGHPTVLRCTWEPQP